MKQTLNYIPDANDQDPVRCNTAWKSNLFHQWAYGYLILRVHCLPDKKFLDIFLSWGWFTVSRRSRVQHICQLHGIQFQLALCLVGDTMPTMPGQCLWRKINLVTIKVCHPEMNPISIFFEGTHVKLCACTHIDDQFLPPPHAWVIQQYVVQINERNSVGKMTWSPRYQRRFLHRLFDGTCGSYVVAVCLCLQQAFNSMSNLDHVLLTHGTLLLEIFK